MQKYTYKEILIGLREEYLKNQAILNKLKTLVNVYPKEKINDYKFHLGINNDKTELMFYIETKKKFLENIMDFINEENANHLFKTPVFWNNNGKYSIGINEFYASIKDSNNLEFDTLVKKLINSNFSNNIYLDHAIESINGHVNFLNITPSGINVISPEYELFYLSLEDRLVLVNDTKSLDYNILTKAMNSSYPSDKFNDYHREIIENTPNLDKDLIIDDNIELTSHEYIISNGKKLILTKK